MIRPVSRLPSARTVFRAANPLSRRNLLTVVSAIAAAAVDIAKLAGNR